MFAGKTESLIARLQLEEREAAGIVAARPSRDTRAPLGEIVSHAGSRRPAVCVKTPEELHEIASGRTVLGVDELHFFDQSIIDVLVSIRASGTRVIAAGLDLDFRAIPFATTTLASERADTVDRLVAVCPRCGGPATLTQRLIDGAPAPLSDPLLRVGAAELYEARCRSCYFSERALLKAEL